MVFPPIFGNIYICKPLTIRSQPSCQPPNPAANLGEAFNQLDEADQEVMAAEREVDPAENFWLASLGVVLVVQKLVVRRWWRRNPIPNHLGWCWNPINNGKNYQPQLVSRISAINSSRFKEVFQEKGGMMFMEVWRYLHQKMILKMMI